MELETTLAAAGLFLALFAFATSVAGQLPPLPFEEGEAFPDLAFPTPDHTPSSIAQFRGHKVILHIFASW